MPDAPGIGINHKLGDEGVSLVRGVWVGARPNRCKPAHLSRRIERHQYPELRERRSLDGSRPSMRRVCEGRCQHEFGDAWVKIGTPCPALACGDLIRFGHQGQANTVGSTWSDHLRHATRCPGTDPPHPSRRYIRRVDANRTAASDKILAALDEPELVRHLTRIIQVPSVTGSAAESELQQQLAFDLAQAGMDVDHWQIDLDELRTDPDYPGEETDRTEAFGLAATTGPGVPGLVLQGHVDVVPVGERDAWGSIDPFSGVVRDGSVMGRGAADMKAGVAAIMAVARAIQRSGVQLDKPLGVHFVVSEEDGGLGALATLRRGHTGEAAVIPEPTDGNLIVANAGALTFALRVPGKAAHGSSRYEGHSAVEAFEVVHAALRRLENRLNTDPDPLFAGNRLPFPLSIGRVRAGDWSSTVPDLLVAEGRLGVPLGLESPQVQALFEQAVNDACAGDPWLRSHPVEVSWPGGQFAPGQISPDHPLIAQTRAAAAAVGAPVPHVHGAPYGSDLRLYNRIGGIPTLHYGPGHIRWAHAVGERVPIAQTIGVARALAVLTGARLGWN